MATDQAKAVDIAVGRRIRNLRLRKHLSQTAVAEHLNLTFQQVQKYEKGQSRISSSQLFKLSELFGVSVDSFFNDLHSKPRSRVTKSVTDQITDRQLLRLIRAYEQLKPRSLKNALLQLAEQMAQHQTRPK